MLTTDLLQARVKLVHILFSLGDYSHANSRFPDNSHQCINFVLNLLENVSTDNLRMILMCTVVYTNKAILHNGAISLIYKHVSFNVFLVI